MPRPPVTACIITYNEEGNVRRCLESVKWADEIVVVDAHSADATADICREYTEKIFYRPFSGHIEQKNFALQCASHDWVLCVDADEELSPALIEELQAELAENHQRCEGFLFPRRAFYLGRWIEHCGWSPDYKLRLFRRSVGRWGGINPHDRVELEGRTRRLRSDMLHYSYRDLSHHLETVHRYSTIYAGEALQRGESFSAGKLVLRPVVKFLEVYFYKKGFLDGMHGLIIACLYSYYVFLRYAKMWEAGRGAAPPRER